MISFDLDSHGCEPLVYNVYADNILLSFIPRKPLCTKKLLWKIYIKKIELNKVLLQGPSLAGSLTSQPRDSLLIIKKETTLTECGLTKVSEDKAPLYTWMNGCLTLYHYVHKRLASWRKWASYRCALVWACTDCDRRSVSKGTDKRIDVCKMPVNTWIHALWHLLCCLATTDHNNNCVASPSVAYLPLCVIQTFLSTRWCAYLSHLPDDTSSPVIVSACNNIHQAGMMKLFMTRV